jgi:hypothetical protein
LRRINYAPNSKLKKEKKMKSKCVGILLAMALVLGLAGAVCAADTTYDPSTNTIEKTKPFTESYDLIITPPNIVFEGSATTDMVITANGDNAAAAPPVTAAPMVLFFRPLGGSQTVAITVEVADTTDPGSYTYSIVSKRQRPNPPAVDDLPGWGDGSATLTVVVAAPTPTDTTPPSVTIAKPNADQAFAFCTGGTPVDIAFNARDAEGGISEVAADVKGNPVSLSTAGLGTGSVDAGDTYTAAAIGAYTVNAQATSEGGTGDASANFSVNYAISWLPPLSIGKTTKGGSTIPIKFTVRDCNGAFVHDESVKVEVFEVPSGVQALNGLFGVGSTNLRIDDFAEQYIINFQTASGMHNYRVDVSFNDADGNPFRQGSKTFWVR